MLKRWGRYRAEAHDRHLRASCSANRSTAPVRRPPSIHDGAMHPRPTSRLAPVVVLILTVLLGAASCSSSGSDTGSGSSASDAGSPTTAPPGSNPAPGTDPVAPSGAFTLSSPDFEDGGDIPKEFSCQGAGTQPAMRWSGVPDGTKSLTLVVFDPDAGQNGFVHWGHRRARPRGRWHRPGHGSRRRRPGRQRGGPTQVDRALPPIGQAPLRLHPLRARWSDQPHRRPGRQRGHRRHQGRGHGHRHADRPLPAVLIPRPSPGAGLSRR